jgi:hypothetical protein
MHSETRRVCTILLENLTDRGYLGNQDVYEVLILKSVSLKGSCEILNGIELMKR